MTTTVIVIVVGIAVLATAVFSVLIGSFLYKRRLKNKREEAEEKSKLQLKI